MKKLLLSIAIVLIPSLALAEASEVPRGTQCLIPSNPETGGGTTSTYTVKEPMYLMDEDDFLYVLTLQEESKSFGEQLAECEARECAAVVEAVPEDGIPGWAVALIAVGSAAVAATVTGLSVHIATRPQQ